MDEGEIINLRPGYKITLRGIEYTVESIIYSDTLTAKVYKLSDRSGKDYVLKLYYKFRFDDIDPYGLTLNEIQYFNDPNFLKLFDFGIRADKLYQEYCYEVIDYAQGGNLLQVNDFKEKYSREFIEYQIIPQIFNALKKLHGKNIFHLNLKPNNILYIDQEQTKLVISDFINAISYDDIIRQKSGQSQFASNPIFNLSAEQLKKNDYYSFGVVLLLLLYPEQLFIDNKYDKIDPNKLELIVENQHNSQSIVEYNPEYKRINHLIAGLTKALYHERWGEKELEQWQNKGVQLVTLSEDVLKINNILLKTEDDLFDLIRNDDSFYETFIENSINYSLLTNWLIGSISISLKRKISNCVNSYISYGKYFVLVALRSISNSTIIIRNKEYDIINNSDNLKTICYRIFETIVNIDKDNEKAYSFFIFELELQKIIDLNNIDLKAEVESILTNLFLSVKNSERFPVIPKTKLARYIYLEVNQAIEIGDTIWHRKNLDTRKLRNGDAVEFIKSKEDWIDTNIMKKPACCYYNYDLEPNHEQEYGLLYNGNAVLDPRGLAPETWDIPTEKDWLELLNAISLDGSQQKANYLWDSYLGYAVEKLQLSCPTAGVLVKNGSYNFKGRGEYDGFWMKGDENVGSVEIGKEIHIWSTSVSGISKMFYNTFNHGYSVRCVKRDYLIDEIKEYCELQKEVIISPKEHCKIKTKEIEKDEEIIKETSVNNETIEDVEENRYATIHIGMQHWVAENLKVTKFRNGDSLFYAKTAQEWIRANNDKMPACCNYNFLEENGEKYGKLYNFYAISDVRGLAPESWRIANHRDWLNLGLYMNENFGNFYTRHLKAKELWFNILEKNHLGTNNSGFNAMPGGWINNFGQSGEEIIDACWWVADANINGVVQYCNLFYYRGTFAYWGAKEEHGFSVRCIRQ